MSDPESERPAAGRADIGALPPRGAPRLPCARCGYHAPGPGPCPHCDDSPQEPSLRGPAPGPLGELLAGATALPRGALLLARDPRAVLVLAIPVALTLAAFAAATVWAVRAVDAAVADGGPREVDLGDRVPDWLAPILAWPIEAGLAGLAAETAAIVATLLVAALSFWFAFSIVFEALAGPFLDEVHGRFERRWYGADPRARLERPAGAVPAAMARTSWSAALLGVAAGAVGWLTTGAGAITLGGALAPAVVLAVARPVWRRWLVWVAGIELRALRASLAGLLLTGAVLVVGLPLLLVPVLGTYLYGAAAGFATALGLLDIPFGRRGLDLAARLAFLRSHAAATTVYGAVAGLLFGIPFLGPLLVVPAASVGGLWLFTRLDKRGLRERVDARP